MFISCVPQNQNRKFTIQMQRQIWWVFFISSFLFLFSHFLSGVNFLLYLDLFLFLFVNHFANANLSAILSLIYHSFFWYISFAFSGLFLLLSLISAFSEWNFFLVILQEQEHAPAVHRSLSLPVPFPIPSAVLSFSLRLTAACLAALLLYL